MARQRGDDCKFITRLNYCEMSSSALLNSVVCRSQHIGFGQAVSVEYGAHEMQDHIHFEFKIDGFV